VPFDREMGYRVVDVLKEVANRHDATPARVALAWVLGRAAVSSVIIAARKPEQLEDNIRAVDLQLSGDEVRRLDAASDPGVPYPKWMVLQLDTAEDPRSKVLYPERYEVAIPDGPAPDSLVRLKAKCFASFQESAPHACVVRGQFSRSYRRPELAWLRQFSSCLANLFRRIQFSWLQYAIASAAEPRSIRTTTYGSYSNRFPHQKSSSALE